MSTLAKASAATAPGAGPAAPFDVERVRRDFPILDQEIHHGKHLVYLDNAATSQKPQVVMDALGRYYGADNANVHRGVHRLSERATEAYEGARRRIRQFLNAGEDREIVFVRGTTEAINLVAHGWGRRFFKAGDRVVVSEMEHHSNIVPWQMLRDELGIELAVIPMDDEGQLELEGLEELLTARTKLVSVVHVSNALGTVNPVERIVQLAHARGVPVLLDGAQAVPHIGVDVRALDADFYVFSGHKLFGPTGIGVLYGKAERLEAMQPYQGGGDMIRSVTFEKTTYNVIPYKFEAGTPHISGAIALGEAIEWFRALDLAGVEAHERALLELATRKLREVPGVRIIGTAREKLGVVSFVMEGVHPHDIGTVLDLEGVAIRTGHHCAQPVMQHFKVPATARASFALYNTASEIDALVAALAKVREVFC
ncbi:MAG: cysteine desulfurase [Candidatus Wallbacteria bacterium]|nr:cysteine desulfurase [Candidatus Wallbacteria bacterium]